MTRSTAREIAIQLGFAAASSGEAPQELFESFFERGHYDTLAAEDELYSEYPNTKQLEYIRTLIALTGEHRDEIDAHITRYAKGWKLERISRTALAVLRCAICEILYMDDIPNAAAINEAVELDKGYDEPDVVSFVNGVLGGFMRGEFGERDDVRLVPARRRLRPPMLQNNNERTGNKRNRAQQLHKGSSRAGRNAGKCMRPR